MKVLVTGAAGGVARQLQPGLHSWAVRTLDTRAAAVWPNAEHVTGDVADPDVVRAAMDGVDAVVHLAANASPEASWRELRSPNVEAVANVLSAAHEMEVGRVVLASSVHVVGGYAASRLVIKPSWPVRPCCAYGATKAWAEALAYPITTVSVTSVVCLRLGACLPAPPTLGSAPAWLGPLDLQQLVRAALTARVRYGVYFGVSANSPALFDLGNARAELGYEPRLDAANCPDVPDGPSGFCRSAF